MDPSPKDLPLPLPLSEPALTGLLVLFFILHIVFVNVTVGGGLIALGYQFRALREPAYDQLARSICRIITVTKSLAVVLGVGPLLCINLLYTVPFYSANLLTGAVWILIIPLVTAAFLLLYLHKFSWDWLAQHRGLHITILAAAMAILLFIPLIFLTNINLMLFPEKWRDIHGFFDALMLANVLPRWLHFMLASVSASGLLLAWWTSRPGFSIPGLATTDLRRQGYAIALATSGLQFIAGPLVLMTLPSVGLNLRLHLALILGIVFALPALYWMWREIDAPSALPGPGRRFWWIVASLGLTVLFMATARHLYRDEALALHQARFAIARDAYAERSALARAGGELPPLGPAEPGAVPPISQASSSAGAIAAPTDRGEAVFKLKCRACHVPSKRLVGPPLQEVARIYAGNPEGIAAWVLKPGRKRTEYPPMAPVKLPPDDLKAVAEYVLRVGGSATAAAAPPPVRP